MPDESATWRRVVRVLLLPAGWLSERLGNRFYLGLAAVVIALVVWATAAGVVRGMQNQVYDLIVRNRFNTPPPHPDLVLVDIDEASLAAMAPDYGRWPWSRSVMAEFIESIAAGGARAIVADITFADRDLDHPEGDAYLGRVAAGEGRTFFAMIRLNPANDPLSQLKLADLAGVERAGPGAPMDATVAMAVPYFYDQLGGWQLGTNNLHAGADGIARSYHVFRETAGWRVGSLPANVARALGRPLPDTADILINWRGPPGIYPSRSFHEVYESLLSSDAAAAAAEFAGKIVVIGSTAPSLFDIRPTPMAREHPGLEILVTALDNLLTGDQLSTLPGWVNGLVAAVVVVLLSAAFVYNLDYRLLNPIFAVVQASFLVLSYLCLNYSRVLVDLSMPFTAGLVFFFVARVYAFVLNLRRNGHPLFSTRLDSGRHAQVLLVLCEMAGERNPVRRLRALLLRHAGLTRFGAAAPRIFRQSPLLDAHYRDSLLVFWLVAQGECDLALDDLRDMLVANLRQAALRDEVQVQFRLHAFDFVVGEGTDWRRPGRLAISQALAAPTTSAGRVAVVVEPSFAALAGPHEGMIAQLREGGWDVQMA